LEDKIITAWEYVYSTMGFLGMTYQHMAMILIALFLAFLAIYKKYEPLLHSWLESRLFSARFRKLTV